MNISFASVAIAHAVAYNLPMSASATLADTRHRLISDGHTALLMATSNPRITDLFTVANPTTAISELFYRNAFISAQYEGLYNYAPYPSPAVQ